MFIFKFELRRVWAGFSLLACLATAPAMAQQVTQLHLDRAKIVELPPGATTIVVGNPGIADVTLLKGQNRLVLTAKSFGETNLLALDQRGEAVAESILRVIASDHALVVQRGMERESYSCNPRCQPTISLGDTSRHMGEIIGQTGQRNSFATGGNAGVMR